MSGGRQRGCRPARTPYFVFFFTRSRATCSSALPSWPFAEIAAAHWSSSDPVACRQRLSSSAGITLIFTPASTIRLRAGTSASPWMRPNMPDVSRPELRSITARRSAGIDWYLARFIAVAKIVAHIAGWLRSVSATNLVSSSSLIDGAIS